MTLAQRAKAWIASRLTGESTRDQFCGDVYMAGVGASIGGLILTGLLFAGIL